MKKIRNLCLMLSLSIPLIFNLFLAGEVKPGELNDQALAQQLANSKVDFPKRQVGQIIKVQFLRQYLTKMELIVDIEYRNLQKQMM